MDGKKREFDDIEQGRDSAESAFANSGRPEDVEDNRIRKDEKKVDRSLKDTFPASDPPSINPGAD